MGSRYVHITRKEFESFMDENLFVCLNDDQTRQELVYAYMWHDGAYALKVYSSITLGGGARDVGADAIRVVLFVNTPAGMRPMWKAARVYRTQGWRENLQQRIDEGLLRGCDGRDYECPECGAPMILREGKRGPFWGCTMFPVTQCTYTEDYDDEE